MKAVAIGIAVALMASTAVAGKVRGYVKKDGTYVAPHVRTNPNSTKTDNYSTKGNYNPYTGKQGTQEATK
jgi:hypothetical protein